MKSEYSDSVRPAYSVAWKSNNVPWSTEKTVKIFRNLQGGKFPWRRTWANSSIFERCVDECSITQTWVRHRFLVNTRSLLESCVETPKKITKPWSIPTPQWMLYFVFSGFDSWSPRLWRGDSWNTVGQMRNKWQCSRIEFGEFFRPELRVNTRRVGEAKICLSLLGSRSSETVAIIATQINIYNNNHIRVQSYLGHSLKALDACVFEIAGDGAIQRIPYKTELNIYSTELLRNNHGLCFWNKHGNKILRPSDKIKIYQLLSI